MGEWQKVQDQVNTLADEKLNAHLDSVFVGLSVFAQDMKITVLQQEIGLGNLVGQIKSSMFKNCRDAWRTKYGTILIDSVIGK